ncbi:MAG TPA: SDR family oxidoreductase [Candidatus Nitrosocosmicus sp.]|nr:SDR family oxidoreductase [Candidatus Nitrosocosmicus sp.]
MKKALEGKIALVAGSSRGAGRAIALELGFAGAIVYATGRSITGQSTNNWKGTIDDTAVEINASGGTCIPVKCDHRNDLEVEELISMIRRQQGRLDILVNNVWGGSEYMLDQEKPFWERSLKNWDTMFTGGIRAQIVTNKYAIPLLRENGEGLIIHTTFWDDNKYTGFFYYDLAKNAINRMVYGLSIELMNDRTTVVAVSPGWMRTELVLAAYNADESNWRDIADLKNTESPHYVGRAVAALAADRNAFSKTGKVLRVSDLAKEYGFTDIDGRQPDAFHLA